MLTLFSQKLWISQQASLRVNDINNAAPNISIRLFADDTDVFLYNRDCKNLISSAKIALLYLKEWLDTNRLTLHLGKTNYTVFHHNRHTNHECPDFFMIDQNKVCKTSSIKYLGLVIDDQISWKDHIQYLSNKLVKYTSIFYRMRNHLPYNIAIQLYYTFVYSGIAYGIEIYGMAKSSVIKPLQIMQNRILKVLTFKPRLYSINLLHTNLDVLKIPDIYKLCLGTMLFMYTKINYQVYLIIFLTHLHEPCSIRTRTNAFFRTTKHKNKYGKLQQNNYCCKLWESFPLYVQNCSSVSSFKSHLKSSLSSHYTAHDLS